MHKHVLIGLAIVTSAISVAACDPAVSNGGGDDDGGGCEPVACDMFCENGFAKAADGCEICACADAPCDDPNPAGCAATGCDAGEVCDTSVGCYPSSCTCDPSSGGWICTEDCGGGQCVPETSGCDASQNPVGCAQTGCPNGETCDTLLGCHPSSCSCDPATGGWVCTDDCGGGECVPNGGCDASQNPVGCVQTGCPNGETCDTTVGCYPSSCTCDPATGWACTDDCGGGACVPG